VRFFFWFWYDNLVPQSKQLRVKKNVQGFDYLSMGKMMVSCEKGGVF